jgi:hypothetical protein
MLHQHELLPFEVLVHMSVYMYVLEGAVEKRLGHLEAAAYVYTFGAGPYATWVVRQQCKGTFVITAEHCRPPLDLVVLNHCKSQKVQGAEP